MQQTIQTTLQQNFGFDSFRPGQQPIVEYLLAGFSSAAVFPTGGGKSLCYQLPALMLPGVTLVVSPLIALMKDQIDALTARGIAARRLDSTLSADEYRDVMDKVRHGELQMLYVAPERFNIDPGAAAIALNTSRERIILALDWLADHQMLEVKVAGIRHRYTMLKKPDSSQELADELYQRILKREQAEIQRLQQVLEFVENSSCQTTMLAAHFDEHREQGCGHCSFCLNGKTELPQRKDHAIAENIQQQITQLINESNSQILKNSHILARFLCGVTSPHLSKAKLTKHPLFSVLENVPFKQVQAWLVSRKWTKDAG